MPTQVAHLAGKVTAEVRNATQNLRDVQNDLEATGQKFDKTGDRSDRAMTQAGKSTSGFGNAVKLAGGILTTFAVQQVGRTVLELGELGAQADRAETTLVNVAGGAEQAAAMLDSVQRATNYTISEMEAMESASVFLSLGLAEGSEELGTMVRNVTALGERFGGTRQSFQLMMSNQSLQRIDEFGLGVEEVTQRVEDYEAAGKSANEAFELAVIDAMNDKFNELGGTLDDNVTKIKQSEAAWADLKAEVGKGVAGGVGAFKEATGGIARWAADVQAYTNEAREEFGYVSGSVEGMLRTFGLQRTTVDDLSASMGDLTRVTNEYTTEGALRMRDGLDVTVDRVDQYNQAIEDQAEAVEHAGDLQWQLSESGQTTAVAYAQYQEAVKKAGQESALASQHILKVAEANRQLDLERVASKYNDLITAMRSGLGPEIENYQQDSAELNSTLEEQRSRLTELQQEHGALVTVTNKNAMSTHELAIAQDQLAKSQERMAEADEGSVEWHRAAQDVQELQTKIQSATGATTAYVDNSKRIEEVRAEISETESKITDLEREHTRATGRILMNFAQQEAAADGVITDEEYQFIAGLGEEYGILDEKGATALGNLKRNMDFVREGTISAEAAVDLLQDRIDKLHGKDITIGISYDVEAPPRAPGGTQVGVIDTDRGELGEDFYADGGYLRPGEAGYVGEFEMEAIRALSGGGVQVTPLNGGRRSGGGARDVNINIYGDDPAAIRREVVAALRDHGVIGPHDLR